MSFGRKKCPLLQMKRYGFRIFEGWDFLESKLGLRKITSSRYRLKTLNVKMKQQRHHPILSTHVLITNVKHGETM